MADAQPVDRNYPRCKYHATEPPILVRSADEEAALSNEWFNSPADIPQTKKVKIAAK